MERIIHLLRLALKYDANEIKFCLTDGDMEISMRVDGLCRKVRSLQSDNKLIEELQYLANLKVGEYPYPQTGPINAEIDNDTIKLRFACVANRGVLRILERT